MFNYNAVRPDTYHRHNRKMAAALPAPEVEPVWIDWQKIYDSTWGFPHERCVVLKLPRRDVEADPVIDHISSYEKKVNNGFNEDADWIFIEPPEVHTRLVRWVNFAWFTSGVAYYSGITSVCLCFLKPQYRWVYLPFTAASVGAALLYELSRTFHHQVHYKIEASRVQLMRFPMHTFRQQPVVFRKWIGFWKRLPIYAHRFWAIVCGLYSANYLLFPAPPCACSWDTLNMMVKDEATKAMWKFDYWNYI